MRSCLVGQRGDVEPPEDHVRATAPIVIRDLVGAICIGDVDLDHDQVRVVVQIQLFDVFVLERDVEVRVEIRGEGGETERRKERVFDRPPVGAGGFCERGQDHLHAPDRAGARAGGDK